MNRSRKGVNYEKTRIGRVLKEYSDCFEELLLNREDSHLWLKCSILRMKLNNLLLERLLRDLRKRCNLHIRLLSGANAELYEKRASLLLDEIAKLERKVPELNVIYTADVERHWAEGEVHALEMEFYQQKDYKACKGLWDKLREEETRLKLAIENKEASSNSTPPAKGMRVPPIGFPVDIGASLPLATVDPDFIVLGFCALVLIGGTLYFWFKDDGRDDDGDSGGGGRVSKSGIAPVSGLKELVPPVDSGRRGDVPYFDFYGLSIKLYYGESVVGQPSVYFGPICSFLHCAFFFVLMVLCFCCLPKSPGKTTPSTLSKVKVSVRPYILLTLSYVTLTSEVQVLVDVSEIIARITKTFECKSVIVSKMGNQYNVGIWNSTASRYTAVKLLRSVFPEFEDCQVNVSFHKGWNSICKCVMKKDRTPVVWGEEPLFLVKNRARAAERKTQGPDLANLLRTKNSWEEVLADDQTIEGKELLELVPTTHDKAQSDCLAKNTLRKYLLLTLNHAERENRALVTAADIIDRLNSVFNCRAIIISKELHRVRGHHLHIGVWNENASKNTVNQRIRKLFPEFEGRQCNVSAHRIWDTVCQYILKQDNTPVVWGEESLEEIKNRLDAKQNKKKKNELTVVPKFQFSVPKVRFSKGRADNVEVLRRLSEKSEWIQVLKDELLGPRCVTNYNNLRQIFIDMRLDLVKNSKYFYYLPNFIKLFLFKNLRAIYLNQFGFLWLIFFLIPIAFSQTNLLFLLKQLVEIYLNQWFTSATQWFTSATFLHEFFIHFEKEFANFEIDKEIIATFEEKLAANNIIPETNSSWTTHVILIGIGIGIFCYIIYVLSSRN